MTLNPKESRELEELLTEYRDIFIVKSDNYGRNDRVYQIVDTGEARPIRQSLRSLPLQKQVDLDKMLDDIQRCGIIEESDSPRSSPIILVWKNRNLRFSANYMKLYDVLWKDYFPLSQIDYTLVTLVEAKCFSTVDLQSHYWQGDLHLDDKEKAACSMATAVHNHVHWICNAPATFERLMEIALRGLSYKSYLMYLDEVIVIGLKL